MEKIKKIQGLVAQPGDENIYVDIHWIQRKTPEIWQCVKKIDEIVDYINQKEEALPISDSLADEICKFYGIDNVGKEAFENSKSYRIERIKAHSSDNVGLADVGVDMKKNYEKVGIQEQRKITEEEIKKFVEDKEQPSDYHLVLDFCKRFGFLSE